MIPIFIIGGPRTGSSTMCGCLRKCLNIQGYNEGHFLKYLNNYRILTNEIYNNLKVHEKSPLVAIGNIKEDILYNNIRNAFKETYESLFDRNQKYWVDKTPDNNLFLIREIIEMWPESIFIMIKRRSIENINSRVIKFPEVSFEHHCESWNSIMKFWYDLDKSILSNYIEIDHYDMIFNTEYVSESIIKILPDYSHKKKEITNYLLNNHIESKNGKVKEIVDISDTNWSEAQKKTHMDICQDTLKLYNYSIDKNYFII
jgi:hypothetical protein